MSTRMVYQTKPEVKNLIALRKVIHIKRVFYPGVSACHVMLGTHFEALKSLVTKVAVVVREPKRISENTYILQVRNVPA